MAQITDPVKLREIAERNQSLGFGSISSVDGVDRYVRGAGTTSTDPTKGVGTGWDIEPTVTDLKGTGTYTGRDTSVLDTAKSAYDTGVDENAIYAQEQARIQAQIEAIQRQADVERAVIAQESKQRTGQTRSIGARSGLLGSTFGQAQADQTSMFNQQQREMFEAQVNAQIAAMIDKGNDRAAKEIEAQRNLQSQNYDRYIEERDKLQTDARNDLMLLGSTGGTLDGLDSASKDLLLKQAGMSEFAANAIMLANNPKTNAKYQVVGNKFVGYYMDPLSGEVKTVESEAIPGLDPDADIQTYGGVPYVLTKDADGNIQGSVLPGFKAEEGDPLVREVGGSLYQYNPETKSWDKAVAKPAGSGTTEKTITWEMAKDLGDLSLYGQPVSKIPAGTEYKESTYTTQEKNKLRNAGVDPNDTVAADRYLYGAPYAELEKTVKDQVAISKDIPGLKEDIRAAAEAEQWPEEKLTHVLEYLEKEAKARAEIGWHAGDYVGKG